MRTWVLTFTLLTVALCYGKPLSLADAANHAASAILAQQTSDGAITMAKVRTAESSVVPYFGCFAAQGLLAVYASDHDPKKLAAAKQWIDWYAAHQNSNGTIFDFKGHSNAWKSTGHYDSTDSYAAVYLNLLWSLHQVAPDTKWLKGRSQSINRAVAGIRLTIQPCGLTIARPDYPVMYTMDNVETLQGLRAASRLAAVLGDGEMSSQAQAEANKMQAAILTLLWDEKRLAYRIAIQVDGGKMEGLKDWYPDVMANLMAVAWLPPSSRDRDLFVRLYHQFGSAIPQKITSEDDVEHLVWWGWAAKGAGDSGLLNDIRHRFSGFEKVTQSGCDAGLLGHIARLTTLP